MTGRIVESATDGQRDEEFVPDLLELADGRLVAGFPESIAVDDRDGWFSAGGGVRRTTNPLGWQPPTDYATANPPDPTPFTDAFGLPGPTP